MSLRNDCKLGPCPFSWIKCKRCNIVGHWREQCPQKDMEKLKSLSENELRELAIAANMSDQDMEKWIRFIRSRSKVAEYWRTIRNIDNALNKHYKCMKLNDYKDLNGVGKFLKHCKVNNLSPPKIDIKLQNLYENAMTCSLDVMINFRLYSEWING